MHLSLLLVTIVVQGFFKGFLSLIPVLCGIIVGYIVAIFMGLVHFAPIAKAKWLDVPHIYLPFRDYEPSIHLGLILVLIPVVFVTVSEHIGHQLVINKIVGKNFSKIQVCIDQLLVMVFRLCFASIIGGPPSTTYGENIGVLAITKIYSIYVIGGAAVSSQLF